MKQHVRRLVGVSLVSGLSVLGIAGAATAHAGGGRPALTAAQQTCLTGKGHVGRAQTAAEKTAHDAMYTACGITPPSGSRDAKSASGSTSTTVKTV